MFEQCEYSMTPAGIYRTISGVFLRLRLSLVRNSNWRLSTSWSVQVVETLCGVTLACQVSGIFCTCGNALPCLRK